jgi:hypothetical protein
MIGWPAKRYLRDSYRFPGFKPSATVVGVFGDRMARVIVLSRREKKRPAARVDGFTGPGTIASGGESVTCRAATGASSSTWRSAGSSAGAAGK